MSDKDAAIRKRLHDLVDEIGDFGWREFAPRRNARGSFDGPRDGKAGTANDRR